MNPYSWVVNIFRDAVRHWLKAEDKFRKLRRSRLIDQIDKLYGPLFGLVETLAAELKAEQNIADLITQSGEQQREKGNRDAHKECTNALTQFIGRSRNSFWENQVPLFHEMLQLIRAHSALVEESTWPFVQELVTYVRFWDFIEQQGEISGFIAVNSVELNQRLNPLFDNIRDCYRSINQQLKTGALE